MASESSYPFSLLFSNLIISSLLPVDGAAAVPAPKRPNVQMPDEYLPPNKILFLQNLPESVTKDQLMSLFSQYAFCFLDYSFMSTYFADPLPFRYPNLYEVRLIPTKRDIAFVEYMDEGSAGVAKDALHNYKLDGENKIKVCFSVRCSGLICLLMHRTDYVRQEVMYNSFCIGFCVLQQ